MRIRRQACSQSKTQGYTLVEVLIATVILIVGVAFLYGAFFKSGENLNYLTDRFYAKGLAYNLIVETEKHLGIHGNLKKLSREGRTLWKERVFNHHLAIRPLDIEAGLYEVQVRVRWEDSQPRRISRTAFVLRS